ncbi:uncharacterized protein LOC117112123 [Anneissia japonica]|uniref:uncharacterized protein LOC117112123 n=1 Tax=Anneissia japonica TaxID=1529436 RepID=UPI00142556CA|nr:uncharacterized protein LOC117112123 [Anneissia japonica]
MVRFMFDVILLLELHAYLVSSRGIMDRTMPTNISCQLDIEGAKALEVVQREGSVYINMNLKFVNSSGIEIDQILNETSTIVNIKRWVLAVGPRGVQLLKYPHNVVHLSLGTLKPGVQRVSLNVLLSVDCFLNADDDKKLDIIATSLANFQSTEGLKLDQAICLEQLLTPVSITSPGEFYFDCWRLVIGNEYYRDKTNIRVVGFLSLLVIFYLSYFLLSFLCPNPPLIIGLLQSELTEYISINTDLNIGVKYVLFFAGNECCCSILYILRCLVYLSLWQYLPLTINYILVDEEYRSTDFFYVSVIFNPITIVCTTVAFYMYKRSTKPFLSNQNWVQIILRQLDNSSTLSKLNESFDINNDPTSHLTMFQKTVNDINQIMVSLVTLEFWKGIWKETEYNNWTWNSFAFVCKFISIIMLINPLTLIILHFADSMKKSYWRLLILFLYFLFVYVWFGFSVYLVVNNLLQILYYFFIGLLTNSSYIFNVVFVSFLIIVYFLTTVTDLNAGYVKFLRQVIDSMDKVVEKHTAEPDQAHVGGNSIGQHSHIYVKRNGLMYIKKEFFYEIVKKYRPIGPKTVIMLVKLAVSGLVIYIAADTLESIDQIQSLSVEVRSIPVILIPLVIPFFCKLIKNEAQEENEIEVIKA